MTFDPEPMPDLVPELYTITEQLDAGGVVTDYTDGDLIWFEVSTPRRVIEVVLWGNEDDPPFTVWHRALGSYWMTAETAFLGAHGTVEATVAQLRTLIAQDAT